MLLDILTQSVNEFQADCLKLCEKHYPTIHNQGMSEHHLGLAFARRLARTLTEFGHRCEYAPIESVYQTEQPHHYRISSDAGQFGFLRIIWSAQAKHAETNSCAILPNGSRNTATPFNPMICCCC